MEVSNSLGEPLPSSPIENRSAKVHPALPYLFHEGRSKNKDHFVPSTSPSSASSPRLDKPLPTHPPPRGGRPSTPSTPISPIPSTKSPIRSPVPTMGNSPKKIFQLTGHDSSIDRSLPIRNKDDADDSPTSSGSCYSSHDEGSKLSRYSSRNNDIGGDQHRSPTGKKTMRHGEYQFQPGSPHQSPLKDRGETTPLGVVETLRSTLDGTASRTFLGELPRDAHHPGNSTDRLDIADSRAVLPQSYPKIPRREKTKPLPIVVEILKKPSFFANARDNFVWAIDDITSPLPVKQKHKQYNTPVTGTFPPSAGLGSPRHLPHSPLSGKPYGSEPSSSMTEYLHRRISNSVKHWSPIRSPANTKSKQGRDVTVATTISTFSSPVSPSGERRRADTPIPPRSSFIGFSPTETLQRGNVHFLDAVAKARAKAHIKTKDEKKRESLKKRIVVVGVVDQSPDGRLSEWV